MTCEEVEYINQIKMAFDDFHECRISDTELDARLLQIKEEFQ